MAWPTFLHRMGRTLFDKVRIRALPFARPIMDNIVEFLTTRAWREILAALSVSTVTYFFYKHLLLAVKKEYALDFTIPIPFECDPEWKGSYDDGDDDIYEGMREDHIQAYCPADGRVLGSIEGDGFGIRPKTEEGIDILVRRAKDAQVEWVKTNFGQRRRVLRTLLKYILDHQDEIVQACCLDSGKTRVDASFGEILVTVEKLKWTIDHGERGLAPSQRPTNLLMFYKRNTVYYEPLGVTSACVSWNYPFHNFISPIITAIFAGNSIVVKPSEQTAWSSFFFTNIVKGAIATCGHSHNIVQTALCFPDVANYLTSHPDISHLTFIGSRPVAHEVCRSAASSLTPVTVELGGKDPAIILDDKRTIRNLPSIASILMRGVFQSAGQNCIGIERVIALPGTYSRLIEIIEPRVKALRLGSDLLDSLDPSIAPVDMGAMISPARFDDLEALITTAVESGAKLVCGGTRYDHPRHPRGHYFSPTLLVDVTPEMQIAQTELFAPIFLLMRAETVDDAITIANGTYYALGASVFGHKTSDVERCVREVSAGMVAVNDFSGATYATQMPFGGQAGSGYGRFAGEEGLRSVSNIKAVSRDQSWAKLLGISTQIPGVVDLPIPVAKKAWEFCKGIMETGYGESFRRRVRGARRMVRNA